MHAYLVKRCGIILFMLLNQRFLFTAQPIGAIVFESGNSRYSFDVALIISRIQKVPRLLVASQDGYLYIYNLDPNDGGECMLLRQHR